MGYETTEVFKVKFVWVLLRDEKFKSKLRGFSSTKKKFLELANLKLSETIVDNSKHEVHEKIKIDRQVGAPCVYISQVAILRANRE